MKRRKFIEKVGVATAGSTIMPYILPSGRLFAATGRQSAQHVVFVLFGGGVRQQESIEQRYLDIQTQYTGDIDLQGMVGNIMPNMLTGDQPDPDGKIVYGMDDPNGIGTPGVVPIPTLLNEPLQKQGVLFKELTSNNAGHYTGLSTLVSGNYTNTQQLRSKPSFPTIFEYIRKHLNVPASKVWYISNTIMNSFALLNYSAYNEGYGAPYGANMFAPATTFGPLGQTYLADAKNYHPEEDFGPILHMRDFLNKSFLTTGGIIDSIGNSAEEQFLIKEFMKEMYSRGPNNVLSPIVNGARNGDLRTMVYATEVMNSFEPVITSVNMSGVDTCHSNYTNYLRALHRADHAVGYMWNYIQSHPVFKDNTLLILAPECGRNADPNGVKDFNDFLAFDHSDANARRIFGMMAGPDVPADITVGDVNDPKGNMAEAVLTICESLGIKETVQSEGFLYSNKSWFDYVS